LFCGNPLEVELGAAWQKRSSESDRDYLSVKLDAPSFPAPIYATLAEVDGRRSMTPPSRDARHGRRRQQEKRWKIEGLCTESYRSAASGLVCHEAAMYVITDDDLHLGVFPVRSSGPGGLIRLFDGVLPQSHDERKKQKPDLEALTLIPPQ